MHSTQLFVPLRVVSIKQEADMGYFVTAKWNAPITKPHAPLRGLAKDAPAKPQGNKGTEKVFTHAISSHFVHGL